MAAPLAWTTNNLDEAIDAVDAWALTLRKLRTVLARTYPIPTRDELRAARDAEEDAGARVSRLAGA